MEKVIALAGFFAVVAIIYASVSIIPNNLKDWEVIQPEADIKCVVVSRAMNTSVDCWKVETLK